MTEARHLADTSHSEEHRHDVEEHAYTHDHDHGNPVISRCWQWITVIGNLASGVGELKTGNISTLVASADGVHNVGDMITYYMQAENILDQNMSEQKRQRMRKVAHWIIATTSVGVGAKAGMDWGNEHTTDPATIYWAGASLAFSGLMLTRLRQGIRRKRTKGEETVHEKDLEKHFWKVDIPSAACAVAGTALQKYNVHTEQILAMMSAGIATWAFRPTKKNLNHDCLGGLFGDAQAASQPDATEEAPDSRHWANGLRRLWDRKETTGLKRRTKLGMCAAGLALGSGLIVGDTLIDARPKVPRGTLALATPSQPVRKTPPPATSPPITTYSVKLRSGDSQWHLVEERLRSATGRSQALP